MNDINRARPLVMHVDLNSAFATIEQQARPKLRGRPVAVVNRRTINTSIITASYEAKASGVKVGMLFREAKALCPGLIAIESDPIKYRHVYKKLLKILQDYSPSAMMKSIDEGLIDFKGLAETQPMIDVGFEIKQRLKNEIGCAMRCNVGIGTNRFLAKTAASLHKPDGLDEINDSNLRAVYAGLKLQDLTGIARRYAARLEAVGITTPLEFLDTDESVLERIVFKGIVGKQWFLRLRGWEVDDREFEMGRVGRQYVLENSRLSFEDIMVRLHHLCESVGGRLRSQNILARGVYVYARSSTHGFWHGSRLMPLPFFSDKAIYALASDLFINAPPNIREIGVHVYKLGSKENAQLTIFGDQIARDRRMSSAIDDINYRWGERTIHSAHTLNSGQFVKQKIPFGGTRYF